MTNGFWTGGSANYEAGLKEHYESRLANPRRQLPNARPDQITALKETIQHVEQEHQEKLRSIRWSLF